MLDESHEPLTLRTRRRTRGNASQSPVHLGLAHLVHLALDENATLRSRAESLRRHVGSERVLRQLHVRARRVSASRPTPAADRILATVEAALGSPSTAAPQIEPDRG